MMGSAKSLLVIADEHFVPANHGGRVDRWNRWRWLGSLGWSLSLIAWVDGKAPARAADDLGVERQVFGDVISLTTNLGLRGLWKRISRLGVVPMHAASRAMTGEAYLALRAKIALNRPDAVVLDGLYGALLALRLSRDLEVPLIYRAHNVEYLYMRGQARSAVAWRRKLALGLATLGLRRFETELRKSADWCLDISMDDLRHWQKAGLGACSWAPPLFGPKHEIAAAAAPVVPDHDLVYLGNLHTPNNLAGLNWFLSHVLPRLRSQRAGVTLLLAGSNPESALAERARAIPGVTLLENPPLAREVLARGRIIMNPVLSGSGVNIKTVEALFHAVPVVTTSVGAQGLPDEVRRNLIVADTPEAFAETVLNALHDAVSVDPARGGVLDQFGRLGAERLSMQLHRILQSRPHCVQQVTA